MVTTNKQGIVWWERRRVGRRPKKKPKLCKNKNKVRLKPLYNPLDLGLEVTTISKTLFFFFPLQIEALALFSVQLLNI